MLGNGQKCDCGKHEGIGSFPNKTPLSPADRVARYKRLLEKLPSLYTEPMQEFVEDYERIHGAVEYEMKEVGVSDGSFLTYGQKVLAPVAVGKIDTRVTSKRNWTE